MYRPNRIGPFKIGNLDKPYIASAIADFATEEFTWQEYKTNSLNIISGENFASEHIVFSDPTLHISSSRSIGFGVQVSGIDYARNYVYGISGSISFNTTAPDSDLLIECVLGRLAAAPAGLGSAAIAVPSPIVVPCNRHTGYGSIKCADVNTQIVTSRLDGGSPPASEYDICAFWRVVNGHGIINTTSHLHINLALHRYAADLETNDPNR